MSFGRFLLAALVAELTAARVARRLGLSPSSVSMHLHGRRTPGARARLAYARLGVDAAGWDRVWP